MSESQATMIGCPSCAGCLRIDHGPEGHCQFVCSVGHRFSLWELYGAKETELEHAQWSTISLLMHLQMILEKLLESPGIPDKPDTPTIHRRLEQVEKQIASVRRVIEGTTMPARDIRDRASPVPSGG